MVVVLEMKRVSAIEDGGCAWMALNEPSISPSTVAAVAVSVVIGGCAPLLSIPSFAALK